MKATEPTGCPACDRLQAATNNRVDMCKRCADDLARYNQRLRIRRINYGIQTEEITERVNS